MPDERIEALKRGIVVHPHETFRWLILADYLDEHDQPEQAELLRLHRKLLAFPLDALSSEEFRVTQSQLQEKLLSGVQPCVIRQEIMLPGKVRMVFSWIPPGQFMMGEEHPQFFLPWTEETIDVGFWMGIYPVTQEQWTAVMGTNPSSFVGDKRPVEQVSWYDVQEFIATVKEQIGIDVRLPSETEWEYACRAGTTSVFSQGNGAKVLKQVGWYSSNSGQETHAVGQLTANAWGLFDMHGNVYEWLQDWHSDAYPMSRGGCWMQLATHCSSAAGTNNSPTDRHNYLGFRLVQVPSE